jgi:primosomal protein N' (replication factor Y)
VAVPFGKSKIYTALVVELHQRAPLLYEAKEIHQILDEKPIVNEIQIKHWQWIASYYMCSIGDVYRGALPSALLLESETIISQKANQFVDESQLSDDEFLVYEALQNQSSLKVQDIMAMQQLKPEQVQFLDKVNDEGVYKLWRDLVNLTLSEQLNNE